MQFTVLKTFFSDETQSEYVEGLSYTVRSPSDYAEKRARTRCESLVKMVPQWLTEGRVRVGVPAGGQVRGG